jgi:hypothetical protein
MISSGDLDDSCLLFSRIGTGLCSFRSENGAVKSIEFQSRFLKFVRAASGFTSLENIFISSNANPTTKTEYDYNPEYDYELNPAEFFPTSIVA